MLRFLVAAIVWLAWSGHYSTDGKHPLIPIFGLFSVAFVLWMGRRMEHDRSDRVGRSLGWRTIPYLFWLLKEIVKSSIDVARIVVRREIVISPCIVRVPASQRTVAGQVLYANSITLTPGTISLDLRDDSIVVHALTAEFAEGLKTGDMDRRVAAVEQQRTGSGSGGKR